MIIQSLVSLYDRLAENEEVPCFGFSAENIGFYIEIDENGNLIGAPVDLRIPLPKNNFKYKTSIVPYSNTVNVRSSGAATTPNFLVDKVNYIFGMADNSVTEEYKISFTNLIKEVSTNTDDVGIQAVIRFLENWDFSKTPELPLWKEMSGDKAKWIAFRLKGEHQFVHERPAAIQLWKDHIAKEEYPQGRSFLSDEVGDIQPQYAQFKFGSGVSLISFNKSAFESYGKKRGENASIHVDEEFKSSTALKYLFDTVQHNITIGDTIYVFWSERKSVAEDFFHQILNPNDPALTGHDRDILNNFLESLRKGKLPSQIEPDIDLKFYILGFSICKGRMAIRFWHVDPVEQLMRRIGKHFKDLEMERSFERDPLNPGIWELLRETAREPKNISPVLNGTLMRAIMEGTPYPMPLYYGVLNRIRADRRISYLRAAIFKAVLTRNYNMEVPMSLDENRTDAGYLMGRLFAVLEKVQFDALGKVNATVKDRFWGAASATPATVFPRLLSMAQHHMAKARYGFVAENIIREIMEKLPAFPSRLNLQEQGLFAIGYYQQKNDLYRKNDNKEDKGE